MKKGINPNGLILWESQRIVVILTGLKRPSRNDKTGKLMQVFIFYKHELPSKAIKSGNDKVVCGDCKRRPVNAKKYGVNPCYVILWRGPDSVWLCWKNGGYARWNLDTSIFNGKLVRFGAYGDPAYIPQDIVWSIAKACKGHTGYTHQWRNEQYRGYRKLFKASVDTVWERGRAKEMGWSTFRARGKDEILLDGEHECPASEEAGFRKKCESCMMCNGKGWDEAIIEHR